MLDTECAITARFAAKRIELFLSGVVIFVLNVFAASAQVDPYSRNQIQLGYDQPLSGRGPQALYLYYYLNVPEFFSTNVTLRLAVAPVYFDGEVGIRLSSSTDLGVGVFGGAYGDNYYEVRQGEYLREESFNGHGGGTTLSLYQRINPRQRVPLNLIVRGGLWYSAYMESCNTDGEFTLPEDRETLFTRAGLRLGGKEPGLFPKLSMELSVWFERQWRLENGTYGFNDDRFVQPAVNKYWLFAGVNYAWTNIGHKISLAFTLGDTDDADRFSAWRLGGVLPLVSEFPLILPGYYYQEISADRFALLYGAYAVPLNARKTWELRFEGAGACVEYLPGFEQPDTWHKGVGAALVRNFPKIPLTAAVRYGYGFDALRDGNRGSHSMGVLVQYDFGARK
jgi:hypothetical protein